MAFAVKRDFGSAGRLFGVPRAWLSRVGAFCSSFCTEGRFLKMSRPDNPDPVDAPVKLGIDESALAGFVDGRIPSSLPPTSHTHAASDVTGLGNAATKNVGTTAGTVAAGDHTHDNYATLTTGSPPRPQFQKNADGTENAASAGTATKAARQDHVHLLPSATMATNLEQTVTAVKYFRHGRLCTVPTGTANNYSGMNLYGLDGDGNITAKPYAAVVAYADRLRLVSSNSSGAEMWLEVVNVLNGMMAVFSRKNNTGYKVEVTDGGGVNLYSGSAGTMKIYGGKAGFGPCIDFHHGGASGATAEIFEQESGAIVLNSPNHTRLYEHPGGWSDATQKTEEERKQVATVGYVDDECGASAVTQDTPATDMSPSSDAENTTTWTAGGAAALKAKKLMRSKYVVPQSGSPVLYGYYRTFTYDRLGRLYSVSAETREPIDTTTLITWS